MTVRDTGLADLRRMAQSPVRNSVRDTDPDTVNGSLLRVVKGVPTLKQRSPDTFQATLWAQRTYVLRLTRLNQNRMGSGGLNPWAGSCLDLTGLTYL